MFRVVVCTVYFTQGFRSLASLSLQGLMKNELMLSPAISKVSYFGHFSGEPLSRQFSGELLSRHFSGELLSRRPT
jgi:hypothetical protein